MTQKSETENSVSALLQTIDTQEIADKSMRQTVEILLNLIEQQQLEIKELRQENQKFSSPRFSSYNSQTKSAFVPKPYLQTLWSFFSVLISRSLCS